MSIGSNLGDRLENIHKSVHSLVEQGNIRIAGLSSIYETEPVGVTAQPMFLNAVCKIATDKTPYELLTSLHSLEAALGRTRGEHWGARIIDIDILLYDSLTISDAQLDIPHPQLRLRRFVLVPLAEIAPHFVPPSEDMLPVKKLLEICPDRSDVKLYLEQKQMVPLTQWGAL